MKTFTRLTIGLCATGVALGVGAPHVWAQTPSTSRVEAPDKSRQFSPEAGEIVLDGQHLMARDQYEAALNQLSESLTLEGLNPFEQSIIYQMQGSSFYELDQYNEAINAFEHAIEAGGLLEAQRRALELNIAQLLIASEQFEKGAVMIEKWHRDGGKLKHAHVEMLWQAWSQAGRYDLALPWAEQWFDAAAPKIRKHFDTLNFFYRHLRMPEKQIDIIEQMIERWPDDTELSEALKSIQHSAGIAQ